MFGHLPELVIILVVALIVFGPDKLPEVAGQIGRAVRDVRSAFDDAIHPEEEPVDFDAYYREYEHLHPNLGEPEVAETLPGVSGTESVEMALHEHEAEAAAFETSSGTQAPAPAGPEEHAEPPAPA
jgi:sec-independent protein translocase protein TatA